MDVGEGTPGAVESSHLKVTTFAMEVQWAAPPAPTRSQALSAPWRAPWFDLRRHLLCLFVRASQMFAHTIPLE